MGTDPSNARIILAALFGIAFWAINPGRFFNHSEPIFRVGPIGGPQITLIIIATAVC